MFRLNLEAFYRFSQDLTREAWTFLISIAMALFAMVMPIGYISHHQRHYKYFEDNVLRPIQQQIYEWGHLNIIEVQTWAYPQHFCMLTKNPIWMFPTFNWTNKFSFKRNLSMKCDGRSSNMVTNIILSLGWKWSGIRKALTKIAVMWEHQISCPFPIVNMPKMEMWCACPKWS